jgi:hypothetical protein
MAIPTLSAAIVNGQTLTLTFNTNVQGLAAAASSGSLTLSDGHAITHVATTGAVGYFMVSPGCAANESVLLSYDPGPGDYPISDGGLPLPDLMGALEEFDVANQTGASVSGIILGPVVAQLPAGLDLRRRTKITAAQHSAIRQSINLYDALGDPLTDLADRDLRFVIADENATGVAQIDDEDIDRGTGDDSSRLYINIPSAATAEAGGFLWWLWDVSHVDEPVEMGRGPFIVERACLQVEA